MFALAFFLILALAAIAYASGFRLSIRNLIRLGVCGFLALAGTFAASQAHAQVFFANTRVGNVVTKHTTVGTSTADAIADADVSPALLAWKICNDAVNTSTYLLVGEAVDVSTDGVSVAPGSCFECPNCNSATLKAIKVEGQASSNGYSVVQYKQQ